MDAEKHVRILKPEFTEDLVEEILVRLPVKSLLRFKCVCKLWYTLFASPAFISTHNKTSKGKKVSLLCRPYANRNDLEGISTLSFQFSEIPIDLPLPPPPPLSYVNEVKIIGCCNGVVCLSFSNIFSLWNPATKQFRTIGGHCNTEQHYNSHYGFYLDPITNSFKLLCVSFPNNHNNKEEDSTKLKVNTYEPSTNSWRAENLIVPYRISMAEYYISPVMCVREYMYWDVTVDYRGRPFEKYILCFDMVDEIFKRIELHPSCDSYCTRLACYKDTIALFVRRTVGCNLPGEYFDVWVMNDSLGTSQSWSHQMTIDPPQDLKHAQGFFIKDEVAMPVVTSYLKQHLLFDPKTQETTDFPWVGSRIEFFQYNESLLSV